MEGKSQRTQEQLEEPKPSGEDARTIREGLIVGWEKDSLQIVLIILMLNGGKLMGIFCKPVACA